MSCFISTGASWCAPVVTVKLGGTVKVQFGRLAILALLAFCSWVMARDLGPDEALRLRGAGTILPLESLLQQALGRYPGARLLEAELEEDGNAYVYEVELLTVQGVVRELKLNASTGQLLEDGEDD